MFPTSIVEAFWFQHILSAQIVIVYRMERSSQHFKSIFLMQHVSFDSLSPSITHSSLTL